MKGVPKRNRDDRKVYKREGSNESLICVCNHSATNRYLVTRDEEETSSDESDEEDEDNDTLSSGLDYIGLGFLLTQLHTRLVLSKAIRCPRSRANKATVERLLFA